MMSENFRCAFRNLRAAPGFTTTAILSLAIGIGGTVSMFTLVKSILLKPLAYPEPDRLVLVTQNSPYQSVNHPSFGIAPIQFLRWRNVTESFESLALFRGATVNLTGDGVPETLGAARISAEFFDTLRVQPLLGRWFRKAEEQRGMPGAAIISASLWRQRFSADPHIIGRKIVLDGAPHEVIGVTRPDLRFFRGRQLHLENVLPERAEIFLPIRFTEVEEQGRFNIVYLGIARLKPGSAPAQARAELDTSLPAFRFNPPLGDFRWWTVVEPLQAALVAETGKPLWILLFAVAFVLLIVCANLANLCLMRTAQRNRELAIRVALGAARRHLLAYSFAESLLLAVLGTSIGLLLSVWVTDAVVAVAPSQIPRLDETSIDAGVLLFSVAVCALTTVLFGVLPAWRASRVDPLASINAAGHGKTETRRSGRIRAALVGAEVSLGTLLAIGSGLLLASLHQTMKAPKGFTADRVLTADITLPPTKYQTVNAIDRFYRGLRDQLAAHPGVVHVAATTFLPLETEHFAPVVAERPGTAESSGLVTWPAVTSEYFEAMDIPLRDGRFFRERETDDVVVISESTARLLWPGENPIGRRLSRPENVRSWLRVVGVAGDVLSAGLDRPTTPTVYRLYSRYGTAAFRVVVRTAVSDGIRESLRQAVSRTDPEIPVPEARPMTELIGKSGQQRRFETALFSMFALIAVLLAGIGVYGVVAYSVLQRRREIGLRLALGADARNVTQLVFKNGMTPVFVGMVAGLVMAAGFSKAMSSLLFNTSALDPIIFIVSPLVLALAGAVPCWLSARQTLRIGPAECLRVD
jgi:predicted permease